MRLLSTQTDPPGAIRAALQPHLPEADAEIEATAREIVGAVRARGDAALRELLERYDGVPAGAGQPLEADAAQLARAFVAVDAGFREALLAAIARVRAYHEEELRHGPATWMWRHEGAVMGQLIRPLERVGIHVPGGKAPLPSTLVMTAVPARVAGVREVIVCTPPARGGGGNLYTLAAAHAVGVDRLFLVGGAQAIAAMAWGTESIPRVEKIVGPGNAYTVAAKRLVYGRVDIESLAGPTEVLVLADGEANPAWIAADLLAQAEHGADSLALLLTPSEQLGRAVAGEVTRQLGLLSSPDTAAACLERHGSVILTRDLDEACDLANECAPEHVELHLANPEPWIERLRHAGAVFVGGYTPEPIGDYIAGPSHVLPTSGTARFSSPLHAGDFLKRTSVVGYDAARFRQDAGHVVRLAEAETLEAHAAAIRIRL